MYGQEVVGCVDYFRERKEDVEAQRHSVPSFGLLVSAVIL